MERTSQNFGKTEQNLPTNTHKSFISARVIEVVVRSDASQDVLDTLALGCSLNSFKVVRVNKSSALAWCVNEKVGVVVVADGDCDDLHLGAEMRKESERKRQRYVEVARA